MSAGFCTFCGAAAAADARFCGRCGKPLEKSAPPAPAEPTDADDRRRDADVAQLAPVQAAPVRAAPEETLFEIRPLVVRSMRELLLCLLTLGIAWICYWVARMSRSYAVTTLRVEVREGIATRRRTALDIFRIEDFEVIEPFFLRLRGAGNLRIWSMDKSEPDMVLEAIPGVQAVYEKLRELTRDERGRNRVRVIEGM